VARCASLERRGTGIDGRRTPIEHDGEARSSTAALDPIACRRFFHAQRRALATRLAHIANCREAEPYDKFSRHPPLLEMTFFQN
jgi:hypothetical protein